VKYVFYVLGILILTLGIAFTIQSELGASPFDALLVGLSVHAGLTVGSCGGTVRTCRAYCGKLGSHHGSAINRLQFVFKKTKTGSFGDANGVYNRYRH